MTDEEKSGGRFRKKKTNFSMISNTIIRDETISLKAKGLYTLIQSYITLDNFTLYKSYLMKKCLEGTKAFESAWKELKETGYLVQYRMQESITKQFYWEYELLDEPSTESQKEKTKPYIQKGYDGSRAVCQKGSIDNGGINNTIPDYTDENNTYQIISLAEVLEQIGFITFGPADTDQVKEIGLLITDILNTPDDNMIWIGKKDIPARQVKKRFVKLNLFHIQYVLMCLRNNCIEITNVRNYLLTVLYNAPTTMNTYFQNRANI